MEDGDQTRSLALAMTVRRFIRAVEQYRWGLARHYDIGWTAMIALGHVYTDGPLPIGELADALSITSAATTEVVDRLEDMGVAQRQPHPTDRRKRLIGITADGLHMATSFYTDFGTGLLGMYEALTPRQRDTVDHFLNSAATALTDPDPTTGAGSPDHPQGPPNRGLGSGSAAASA